MKLNSFTNFQHGLPKGFTINCFSIASFQSINKSKNLKISSLDNSVQIELELRMLTKIAVVGCADELAAVSFSIVPPFIVGTLACSTLLHTPTQEHLRVTPLHCNTTKHKVPKCFLFGSIPHLQIMLCFTTCYHIKNIVCTPGGLKVI